MRIDHLVVAALVSEWTPLVRALQEPRALSHRSVVGRVGDKAVLVMRCGVGPEKAASRTRATIDEHVVSQVWSVGSCGAVAPGRAIGDVVTASSVTTLRGDNWTVPPVTAQPPVRLCTVEAPVFDILARTAVSQTGATVVEMEAAGVLCAAAGVPVSILKVVSDLAGAEPRDPVLVGPLGKARFHRRVERLVHEHLGPALWRAIVS